MTTAASGRNRESLLGPWPARRECRPRHEADAGSHNPVQGGGAQRRKQSAFSVFFAAQIGQNILRLCGQRVRTGSGKLRLASEAPENAQSGQTGIVPGEDVHIAVAHEEGALRRCAEVCHQGVDTGRVGLGGHTGTAAPHQRKAARAEVVLDDLSTKSVRFVGKDGGLDALGLQRGQKLGDAGE